MGKSVAVEGDAQTSAATSHTNSNYKAHIWTPGSISVQKYQKLTSNGKKVIYQASCTFTYAGTDSSANEAPVTDVSTVTLTATQKILQNESDFVLVDGDKESDNHGNEISIIANNVLTTR